MNKFFVLFLGVLSLSVSSAQTVSSQKNTWQLFTYDIGNVFQGMGHAYSRPLHWEGKDWSTFGGVSAATGLLFLFDQPTSDFFRRQRSDIPDFLVDYGTSYGKPEYNYMLTGGVYLTGLFTKDKKLRRTGVLLISSASTAGLLQLLVKYPFGRARPTSGKSKDTFDPFSGDREFHSFPSGHTILSFTNAYAIAKQFKNPWLKAGIYTVGIIPGLSRLWRGDHWLSDVAFGVAVSIFTVESIDRYLDKKYDEKYNDEGKKVSWNLNFGPGQLGVRMQF